MTRITLFMVPLALMLACQAKEGPALPAPTGAGAPPAPAIPTLSEVGTKTAQPVSTAAGPAGTGSLRPRREASLGPKETGAITTIAVDEGERVKRGQVLFRIDAEQAELAVEQAKAALSSAEVQPSAAQLEFGRTKALHERGSVSQDVYDQAKSRLDAAVSAVAQANAALALTQRRASNMVVSAPFDGVVTEKRMNVGEIAHDDAAVGRARRAGRRRARAARATCRRSALRSVHEGSEIERALPSIDVSGACRSSASARRVDPRNRTIEVVADVDNKDHRCWSACSPRSRTAASRETASTPSAPVQSDRAQPRDGARGTPCASLTYSIRRPVFAVMLIAALLVFGLLSYPRIGVDLFPDVEFPVVTVSVDVPGRRSRDDGEQGRRSDRGGDQHALRHQGAALDQPRERLADRGRVRARRADRAGRAGHPRSRLGRALAAAGRHRDAGDPEVRRRRRADHGGRPRRQAVGARAHALADKVVKERIQRVPGVGGIDLVGGRDREIRVLVDPARLAGVRLDGRGRRATRSARRTWSCPPALSSAARARSRSRPRARSRPPTRSPTSLIAAARPARSVRVRDVADVVDGMEEARSASLLDGAVGDRRW